MSSSVDMAIFGYLTKQNRPYSAVDVHSNLHKEHGKTAVVRSLESMAANGKIREKTYGKQKVYCADQNQYPDVDDAELRSMDTRINEFAEQLKKQQIQQRELQSKLSSLNTALTTEEATQQLATLKKQCAQYREKLAKLKNNANSVSPEERAQVMKLRIKYVKEWRKRKRITTDILNAILEGYPKSKKDLIEEVGIETDEDCGVKPPDL